MRLRHSKPKVAALPQSLSTVQPDNPRKEPPLMHRETPDSYFEDCTVMAAHLYDLTERGRPPTTAADWRPYTPVEPLAAAELEQVIAAAADLHRRFVPGNAELPECRHGVRTLPG
jgi:hypothetical protein